MRIEEVDGRTQIYLRQSSIKSFLTCPERARHEFFVRDQTKEYYNDATALGQALHHGIEALLRGNLEPSQKELAAHCRIYFRHIERTHGIRYVQKDKQQCLKYYDEWARCVLESPSIMDMAAHPHLRVEESFCMHVESRPEYELYFEGKPDAVTNYVADWKTANSPYRELEYDLWAPQPTMYVMAANRLGWTSEPRFTYFVFPKKYKDVELQVFSVNRDERHFAFLVEQGVRIADFIVRMGTEAPWPLNDQHWLCSRKWCDNYDNCKGKFLPPIRED